MENRKRLNVVLLASAAVIAAALLYRNFTARKPESDLPPGTVYYSGPMKGKGGQTGEDQFNPYR